MALGPLALEASDPAGDADALALVARQVAVAEQLGRAGAGQLVHQAVVGVGAGPLLAPERAGRDIGDRQAGPALAQVDRGEELALVVQQVFGEEAAGGDHLLELASLDRPIALALDLAADGDPVAHAQQPAEVLALAADGDAGHRQHDRLAVGPGHQGLLGDAQVEQAAQEARGVAVDLEELAVLHQDQSVGALELDARELNQHIAGLNPAVARPQHPLDLVALH